MTGRKFRPMTQYEQAVLDRMLELPFEGRDELRRQSKHALVREIADAGDHAGSIEFKVEGDSRAFVRWSVPVEGRGRDSDGAEVDFLLHLKAGIIDTLEVVKADGSNITRMPSAETLDVALLTYSKP